MKILKYVAALLVISLLFTPQVKADNHTEALTSMYTGNVMPMLPLLAPDVKWVMLGDPDVVPLAGKYEGFRSVLMHFLDVIKAIRIESINPEYIFPDENNRLHVIFSMQGVIRATGNHFDMEFIHLFSFNEQGLITENRIFYDTTTWWAAFNKVGDVIDRRTGQHYEHIDRGILGASTQTVAGAYSTFMQGDVIGVLDYFHPTDFLWVMKGDAIGDNLGAPDEGIGHMGRWEGLGDPFEQPYPTWGFLGSITAMNMYFEYYMPDPPDGELPFQVNYLGSNGGYFGAYIQEIQRHHETLQIAKLDLYHFFVLDEEQNIILGLSVHDNAALCRIDPNCAFYDDMQ